MSSDVSQFLMEYLNHIHLEDPEVRRRIFARIIKLLMREHVFEKLNHLKEEGYIYYANHNVGHLGLDGFFKNKLGKLIGVQIHPTLFIHEAVDFDPEPSITEAKAQGMKVLVLITNGTHFSQRVIDDLHNSGLIVFQITHDELQRLKCKIINLIRELIRRKGFPLLEAGCCIV